MKKHFIAILALGVSWLGAPNAFAAWELTDTAIFPGGGLLQTSNFELNARLDPVAGRAESSNWILEAGVWPFEVQPISNLPAILSLDPPSGPGGETVILRGLNLESTRFVFIGSLAVPFQVTPDSNLALQIPQLASSGRIGLITDYGSAESVAEWTVELPGKPPVISGLDRDSGRKGQKLSISGEFFQGATQVIFGDRPADFFVVAEGKISAVVPEGKGPVFIRVVTPAGVAVAESEFSFLETPQLPVISSFQPATGPAGAKVEITGQNLGNATRVSFNGVPAEFTVLSSSSLRAAVPSGALTGHIAIESSEGVGVSSSDFEVPLPAIPLLVDSFGTFHARPGDSVTLRGSGFEDIEQVLVGNTPAKFKVINNSAVELTVPESESDAITIVTGKGSFKTEESLVVIKPDMPPAKQPVVDLKITPGGQVQLGFETEASRGYVIQVTSNLSSGTWSQEAAIVPQVNAAVTGVSGVVLNNLPSLFFRVLADAEGFSNWDFEDGLNGWFSFGEAFEEQPTFGEAYLKEWVNSESIVQHIGGDYWNTPISLGHHGNFWIGTGQRRPASSSPVLDDPRALNALTGELNSPLFRLTRPFVSFLIGGRSSDPSASANLAVELWVRPFDQAERLNFVTLNLPQAADGCFKVRTSSLIAADAELMRREVWSVVSYLGRSARVRIVDNESQGHLNVDDFRFPQEDPRPGLLRTPIPGVLRDLDAPVWGFADTHTHPASHLGFGGKLIAGESLGNPEHALRSCDYAHGWGGANMCVPFAVCAPAILMAQFAGAGGHRTGGFEWGFDGWPNVIEQGVHQQMYIDWIRRAWQGGLRLMVALAVNNKLVGDLNHHEGETADFPVVQRQLAYFRRMAAEHSDFLEIALTPRQAREIIHRGKLAIVMGLEVDRLDQVQFNTASISEQVDYIHNMGVRHVFPLHFTDNAFGGYAMNNSLWVYNSWWVNNETYPRGVAPIEAGITDPIEWQFHAEGSLQVGGFFMGIAAFPLPDHLPSGPTVNRRGLTVSGTELIHGLMRRSMIIDLDHMSHITKNAVFDILAPQGYPAIAGHAGFTELAFQGNETSEIGKRPSEGDLTPWNVRRMIAIGGMVSPITIAKDLRTYNGRVPNDMPGSSKSWAQTYLMAVDRFGGTNVALATDFTLVHGAGPRFGMKAGFPIKDDARRKHLQAHFVYLQQNGVRYAEPLIDYRSHRFEGPNEGAVYLPEQKEMWEAIAMFKAGANPAHNIYPRARNGKIQNLAKGLFASTDAEMQAAIDSVSGIFAGNSPHEVRTGSYIRRGIVPTASDPAETLRLYPLMLNVWHKWLAMEGNNRPMHRSTMLCRLDDDRNKPYLKEWDINLDGMAHYGLLPDFLQDGKNSGLTRDDLRPLFRSAEDYIRLWERCERNRHRGR